jgi:hypothetical protein
VVLGNGAFSYYALEALKPNMQFNEFYQELWKRLPSDEYPQTPRLEGKAVNLNRVMFSGSATPVPYPEPDPGAEPSQEVPDKWWNSTWFVIVVAVVVAGIVVYTLLR